MAGKWRASGDKESGIEFEGCGDIMAKDAFDKYLGEINEAWVRGDATEHTHRLALKGLIEALGDKVTATNEPRQIGVGYERRIRAGIPWERRQRLEKELPGVWQSGIETV